MKRYAEYKDSGIEWIGEIPVGWERTKLKLLLASRITDGPHETPEILDEGIPFISAEAVKNLKIDFSLKRGYISQEDHARFCKKCKPQYGDIFMIKSGATTGNIAKVETTNEFSVWSPLALIRAEQSKITNDYMLHFLQSRTFRLQVELFWSYGTQQNIGMDVLGNLYVAYPSVGAQNRIVPHLDRKTAAIDSLIADKQKLIDLLKEKRQVIISEAVTKGLDKDAKMKDSGIEWIGEIPEHWETTKIKYCTYVKGRIGWQGLKADEFTDEGPYLVTGTDFIDGRVCWETCYHITVERYNEAPQIQIKNGDLLITKDGTIGKLAIVENMPNVASLNSHLLVLRPLDGQYLTSYLFMVFQSESFNKYTNLTQTGSIMNSLSQEKIENFSFALPEIEEQNRIVDHVNKKISKVNFLISDIQTQIEKLKEYRQSIISEAVTGKVAI